MKDKETATEILDRIELNLCLAHYDGRQMAKDIAALRAYLTPPKDTKTTVLVLPVAYTLDDEKFKKWLEELPLN